MEIFMAACLSPSSLVRTPDNKVRINLDLKRDLEAVAEAEGSALIAVLNEAGRLLVKLRQQGEDSIQARNEDECEIVAAVLDMMRNPKPSDPPLIRHIREHYRISRHLDKP
jgi:hypothetical protein